MPIIEVTGDICSRRPRPTHGCRANGGGGGGDDDDDDDDDDDAVKEK